ncbi:CDK5 regulatory subunit-associated protein 2-like [Brachyhypopomus gauderio]|uniref:CDK5 regulatory subunit-associated protein 2-like n=1 Tax=Brachyhypopomus gauderio TaxID=698409 RepID=UPI00404278DF
MAQLSVLIGQKDKELQALKNELDQERQKTEKENQACSLKQEELNRLQQTAKQLSEDLQSTKNSSQTLKHRLEEMDRENKALSAELEQRNGELGVERRNSLKRDKIIQGLSLLLKEKEKEVEELYGNLEEKEKILAKTREALHKAQLQKHQDYMNMVWDLEQDRAPSDITLTKLRERLREKEKALESFDTLLKEKDVELQQLVNTVKTVQRSSQESEASLQGALNEKDSIIQQLQHSLQLKTTDMEILIS